MSKSLTGYNCHVWRWRAERVRDGAPAQVWECQRCGVFRVSWWAGTGARDGGGWSDLYQQNRYRMSGDTSDSFESVCEQDDPEENEAGGGDVQAEMI